MTDLIPNDLSHLSDEEFNALCPQGEHAPGPEPLSPAAQAVMIACNTAVERLPFTAKPEQFSITLIAAALHAAASKLRKAYANEEYVDSPDDWLDSIAAELEAHQ